MRNWEESCSGVEDDDAGGAAAAATAAFVSIAATADFVQQQPHAPWLRTGVTTLRGVMCDV